MAKQIKLKPLQYFKLSRKFKVLKWLWSNWLSLLFCLLTGSIEASSLEEAHQYYEQGEQASTLLERQKAFNQALAIYLSLEKELHPQSASFYEAIGHCFLQLDAPAWAVLYYYRAWLLDPQNASIRSSLALAQARLGLPSGLTFSPIQRILSFDHHFPLARRLTLFFWLTFITILLYSITLYWHLPWFKKGAILSLILNSLLLLNLFVSYYFVPLEGILIHSTGLYRSPDSTVQIIDLPLFKGSKVYILNNDQQGKWLKIKTPHGIGYIPSQTVRIIEESV